MARNATVFFPMLGLFALLAGGCVTETTTQKGPLKTTQTQSASKSNAPGKSPDNDSNLRAVTDPCAIRLGNICDQLLLYEASQGKLPPRLADLAAASAPDANGALPAAYVCPVSGLPYVYNPTGLVVPGESARLIVYDPTPAHQGARWGIIMVPSSRGTSLQMYVVLLTEKQFRTYLPMAAPLDLK